MVFKAYNYLFYRCYQMSAKSSWDNDAPMFNACLKLGVITTAYSFAVLVAFVRLFMSDWSSLLAHGFDNKIAAFFIVLMNASFPYFYFRHKNRYMAVLDMFKHKNKTKDNIIVYVNMAFAVLVLGLTAIASRSA
jgi:hypothetical protein